MDEDLNFKKTRLDYFYFQIASNHALHIHNSVPRFFTVDLTKNLEALYNEVMTYKSDPGVEKLEELAKKYNTQDFNTNYFSIRASAHIIVVFSALCLESLINDYCALNTSSTYFKKYLDKLDTVSKWVIIPKVILGKEFPTDSMAFELLKKLFDLRNSMVHPKTKQMTQSELITETIELILQKVPACYRAIKEVTIELYKLDPSFSYLNQYKWFWDANEKYTDISSFETFYSSQWS